MYTNIKINNILMNKSLITIFGISLIKAKKLKFVEKVLVVKLNFVI